MDVTSETHAYGDHPRQTLTIHYRDDEPAPCGPPARRPGLLMLHGGYWSKRSGMRGWPERFAAEDGYVVIEARYRLSGDAPWPAQRDDATSALAWSRKYAATWNLDPERIAVFGSSAGGHLATHVALSDRVTALVALSPPLSPYRAWKDGLEPIGPWAKKKAKLRHDAQQLVGCAPSKDDAPCWARWHATVAYHHVTPDNDAPMLLLHFTDDLCPAAHSEDLIQHGRTANDPDPQATLVTIPGRGHAMNLMNIPGVATAIRAFLATHTTPHPG